ncbi:MAG: hypothetical protein HFK08_02520 [Clostridia bacterium]|nr:hypothetical protein [Clostridia bacterium]
MANNAADFTIAANDEYGIPPCRSPVMPYINRSIYANEFTTAVKLRFLQALLRTGFEVFDAHPEPVNLPDGAIASRINGRRPERFITFGYNSYGSGGVFTRASGFETQYCPHNHFSHACRAFCEDIAFSLEENTLTGGCSPESDTDLLRLSNCVCARLLAGYASDYSDAARMLDPDFQISVAESAAKAVCLNLDVPFVEREKLSAYKTLRLGDMGKGVRLLQYLLAFEGYETAKDGIFGRRTESALNLFRKDNSLSEGTVADEVVYRKLLCFDVAATVSSASPSCALRYVQRKLAAKLYDVNCDGIYGEKTEAALSDFQKDNALRQTGIPDGDTVAALKTAPPRPRLY